MNIEGLANQFEQVAPSRSEQSQWRIAWRTLRRSHGGMVGLIGLALMIVVTILAPMVSPHEPTEMDFANLMAPPSKEHPFGTDDLGRDILSRVLWGGRESLRVAFLAIVIAMFGGIVIGMVSGYYGGAIDNVIQRVVDIFLAFPSILLLLSIVAAY